MTRFARGGPANKKKPHEATSWNNMVDRQESDPQKVSSVKRKKEKVQDSSKVLSKAKRNGKSNKKPKLMGKVGLDAVKSSDTSKEDPVSFLTGQNAAHAPGGLACELEKLSALRKDEAAKELKDAEGTHNEKMRKQKPSKDDICNTQSNLKRGKVLQTELTDYLTSLKKDKVLDQCESQEVEDLIKKDQRREKRRLKRIDKKAEGKTCYNCRQLGHTVLECPEQGKAVQQHGTGICFKCGSTEHSMNRCRVKLPPGKYPYAKCFTCAEQGHLSSQCPDNPRGLYPNGGCCATCGSVEHFKKDCPELQKEQGIAAYTIERMMSSFENVEKDPFLEKKVRVNTKKPKLVKF